MSMKLFKSRKKLNISERDPTYKVRYLGNVQTALMKGEGCVDKPTGVLWNNYLKTSNAGLDMKLTICGSGLKALTKEQGLTEYRAHRISYCIAHPKYPKLFIWVYRHEGKKMKVELRCHAVLCKKDEHAKAMAVQLHDKLTVALSEFMREKNRRQTSRLALQRANSLPSSGSGVSGLPMRNKFFSMGQNFKPSVDRSPGAPKLGAISEDQEPEEDNNASGGHMNTLDELAEVEESEEEDIEEEEGVEEEDDEEGIRSLEPHAHSSASSTPTSSCRRRNISHKTFQYRTSTSSSDPDLQLMGTLDGASNIPVTELTNGLFDLEIGNDIEELKNDENVQFHMGQFRDSDDDEDDVSSESGFSEQDPKESSSAGTGSGSSTQFSASSAENNNTSSSLKTAEPGCHGNTDNKQEQENGHSNGDILSNQEIQAS